MSRTSSQQRIFDPDGNGSDTNGDWRQQRSISRNDSQRSLTDYQQQLRQPDGLITTTIDESSILETPKPSVTFQDGEYDQQPQNLQPLAEQGGAVYDDGLQQQFQDPAYDQSYQQQQPDYAYGAGQPYEQGGEPQPEQFVSGNYGAGQYDQPDYQQPSYAAAEPAQESPVPDFQASPSRQQSSEDVTKSLQQRQQSRDSLPEGGGQKSSSPTGQTAKGAKSSVPPSPTAAKGKLAAKGGAEQKEGRNSVGEAARAGRKPDPVQKQPSKTATSTRSKK
jgi:hypothetical protein